MRLIPFATAALIAATTTAYAENGTMGNMGVMNTVTQTTVLNGPYGGDNNATSIAIQQRAYAEMTNTMPRVDRLGYTKLLDLDPRS